MIYDPKIAVTTALSDIVPRLFLTLEKGAGMTSLYLKVDQTLLQPILVIDRNIGIDISQYLINFGVDNV